MNKEWGKPEANNVLGIKQHLQRAIGNGYLQKLKAYGLGRGLTKEQAIEAIESGEARPMQQYREQTDLFIELDANIQDAKRLKKLAESAKSKAIDNAEKKAVSTGDDNVKETSPAGATDAGSDNSGGDK